MDAGATRLHATALGIGERTGNTEMDLLLVNLRLMGVIENDLSQLGEYCRVAADAVDSKTTEPRASTSCGTWAVPADRHKILGFAPAAAR